MEGGMARNPLKPDLVQKWAGRIATWHVRRALSAAVASGALAALIMAAASAMLEAWPKSRLVMALATAALASGLYIGFRLMLSWRAMRRRLLRLKLSMAGLRQARTQAEFGKPGEKQVPRHHEP